MAAGYSGTPLIRKLGLAPGMSAWFLGLPETVRAEIADAGFVEIPNPAQGLQYAHVFMTDRAALDAQLTTLRTLIAPGGMVWVSWPKKAAKVPTDITEDTVRTLAYPLGFVDLKVCAVDAVWSGLKLMIRKELRT